MENFDLVANKNKYSEDELKDRVNYYVNKAEKAASLLETDGYKVAAEFFKPVWNELKAEYKSYQLVSFKNNRNVDTINYVEWVTDVVVKQRGRMSEKMLNDIIFDIRSYAGLDGFMKS